MGCASSSAANDGSYARHPRLLEEHVYQLNLPAPPVNGFDAFTTLQWCRDVQEETAEYQRLQKEAKKKKQDVTAVVPPPKKYYLCLVCQLEPYGDNRTINLQKQKDAWSHLPKWTDSDFMEDILSNGPFYLNDAFLLEHVPTAIRPPAGYAYTEQYVRAYKHHHGQAPTADEITAHQRVVATTVLRELYQYRANGNRDAKGRERSRTMRKLEDILTSMELDAKILRDAEAVVLAEQKAADEKQALEDKAAKEKADATAAQEKADQEAKEKADSEAKEKADKEAKEQGDKKKQGGKTKKTEKKGAKSSSKK